MGCNI